MSNNTTTLDNIAPSKFPPFPFLVKCVDNSNIGSGRKPLDLGAIYTAVKLSDSSDDIYLKGMEDEGQSYTRRRFIIVEQPEVKTPTPVAKVDTLDWKVWRDHGREPGYCACGIPKQACTYHK